MEAAAPAGFERPYVISWNLTYRCNLACDRGEAPRADSPSLSWRAVRDVAERIRNRTEVS